MNWLRRYRDAIAGYGFLAPFLAFYAVFLIYPFGLGLWMSLHDWEIVGDYRQFIGWLNYQELWDDPYFWEAFKRTLQFAVMAAPAATVLGLALALAIVPVIFTVSEDALTAVPRSYREASLALGATPWETAWKVVLPAAAPGILAACVLGFGRAIGETMIVLMASGNAAITSWNFTDSVRSMSATIAAEMGEVVVGSPHYSLLFFIGVELFLFTFILNMAASTWTRKVLKRLTGAGA